MVAPAAKREAVAHLKVQLGLSEQRVCQIAGADRKMARHQSERAPDMARQGRLREMANKGRRFGHWSCPVAGSIIMLNQIDGNYRLSMDASSQSISIRSAISFECLSCGAAATATSASSSPLARLRKNAPIT